MSVKSLTFRNFTDACEKARRLSANFYQLPRDVFVLAFADRYEVCGLDADELREWFAGQDYYIAATIHPTPRCPPLLAT